MTNEMQAHELIELFQKMSRYEAENVYVESDGEWIEFHFEVNQFYYVLSVKPTNGIVALWSDDQQEEIFRAE